MKVFLLAAGLGTRLRPLTDKTPKCLLPIAGKPLLQIWLESLERQGVDEVLVNTHCHPRQVEDLLLDWRGSRLQVSIFHEPVLLGSAGTLLANEHFVAGNDPFFIIYGDNLSQVELPKMLAFHSEHGLPFTLGVFKADDPQRCGIAEIDAEQLVTGFVEKPLKPRSNLAAAGIYVADRRLFDFYPGALAGQSGPLDLGFHIIPRLVGRMKAYFIAEFLMDIGTPESYQSAQRLWASLQTGQLAG